MVEHRPTRLFKLTGQNFETSAAPEEFPVVQGKAELLGRDHAAYFMRHTSSTLTPIKPDLALNDLPKFIEPQVNHMPLYDLYKTRILSILSCSQQSACFFGFPNNAHSGSGAAALL